MNMLASAKSLMQNWVPPTRQQGEMRDTALALLDRDQEAVRREGSLTHLTASVVVVDQHSAEPVLDTVAAINKSVRGRSPLV